MKVNNSRGVMSDIMAKTTKSLTAVSIELWSCNTSGWASDVEQWFFFQVFEALSIQKTLLSYKKRIFFRVHYHTCDTVKLFSKFNCILLWILWSYVHMFLSYKSGFLGVTLPIFRINSAFKASLVSYPVYQLEQKHWTRLITRLLHSMLLICRRQWFCFQNYI